MGVNIIYCFISLIVCCDAVNFTVKNPVNGKEIYTTEEGVQDIKITIVDKQGVYQRGNCSGWCSVNHRENLTIKHCKSEELHPRPQEIQRIIEITLPSIKLTPLYSGLWDCNINLRNQDETNTLMQSLAVNVTAKIGQNVTEEINTKGIPVDTWIYIGCGIASVVLLVIIGQTVFILHLKAKARKAEIDKNLTQKNSSTDELADARYVKTKSGGGVVRDSVIYEALDAVRGGLAPPPPPIETLPVTPKLQTSRHLSQSMASLHPGHAKTTPRPLPPVRENPGKFNTVDRITSLERIKRRPPLPLPKEEIYEVMEVDTPQLQKSGQKNITPKVSPKIAKKQKNPFFGRRAAEPQPQNSPSWQTPGPSGRHPVGPSGHPLPVPMLVLPSMISTSNLKPVKPATKPLLAEIAKKPSRDNIRIPPGQNSRSPPPENPRFQPPENPRFQLPVNPRFQPPGEIPRFQPPAHIPRFHQSPTEPPRFHQPQETSRFQPPIQNFRPPVESRYQPDFPVPPPETQKYPRPGDSRVAAAFTNQGFIPLPTHSKPPMPMPEDNEPDMYYGSSDEEPDPEFDNYDVLPDFRIYGNAPPKMMPK